ncbi:hypothetical protein BHYA_0233g00160 [Botrytis hyacinthi]|uniref:Uncharacterized protein n=1 Tax=Botrytis hyacinthi TaxID=278943 RepID=A0A4Z1GC92_9HELO|nr:hypothetical protein BHYA_0233g00160 [Botrytis hyacinthi]
MAKEMDQGVKLVRYHSKPDELSSYNRGRVSTLERAVTTAANGPLSAEMTIMVGMGGEDEL